MRGIHIVAFLLVLIGAINWGLVGLFNLNLAESLLAFIPGFVTFFYILVGISGIYIGATHVGECKVCLNGKK